jgi:predicted RNA-binding protein YlxR (DUF448 family)
VKQRKIPQRKCLGCNISKPKKELIRIVREPNGTINLDTIGRKNGRGAYICPNSDCLNSVKKNHGLDRAFELKVPDEIYQRLEEQLVIINDGGETIGKNQDTRVGKTT